MTPSPDVRERPEEVDEFAGHPCVALVYRNNNALFQGAQRCANKRMSSGGELCGTHARMHHRGGIVRRYTDGSRWGVEVVNG